MIASEFTRELALRMPLGRVLSLVQASACCRQHYTTRVGIYICLHSLKQAYCTRLLHPRPCLFAVCSIDADNQTNGALLARGKYET